MCYSDISNNKNNNNHISRYGSVKLQVFIAKHNVL